MSGFEIVGVVLALIPIVAVGIDRYKCVRAGKESRQLEMSFKTQQVIFLNTVEELISPLVSDAKLQALLKEPNGSAWHDKQLSDRLEEHLGGAYHVFMDIMEDIKSLMVELQGNLTYKKVESLRVHRRIKVFLSRSQNEAGLERLCKRIADLHIIEGQSQRLAPSRRMKNIKMEPFGKVRERALSLYDALARGWKCQCRNPHLANLRLEARKYAAPQAEEGVGGEEKEEIRFRFLFSFASDKSKGAGPLDWHEAELAPLDDIDAASRSREYNVPRQYPTGTISVGGSRTQNPEPQITSTSKTHHGRAIRFEFPKTPATLSERKGEVSGASQTLEIEDLCQWIRNVQTGTSRANEECLGYLSSTNKSRYGLYSVNARKDVEPPLTSIHIGEPLLPASGRGKGKSLPAKRQKFSNRTKTQLAFTLGSTMLQLHSTPWLDKWKKQDILYFPESRSDMELAPVQPYISRRFSSSMSTDSAAVAPNTSTVAGFAPNETLFTLGVILIEIAYNKTIEAMAQPGEMAQMAAVTQYVTAMRLRKEVGMKMGFQYQRAVEGCLMCHFGVQGLNADLKSLDFQRKYLDHVVQPLEASMLAFSPAPPTQI